MLFHGSFTDETVQCDRHRFDLSDSDSIHITLLEGAFEHVLLILRDPAGTPRAQLSYKTHLKQRCLSRSVAGTDNGCVAGPLPSGTWSVDVVRTYPVAGGYSFSIEVDLGAPSTAGENPLAARFDAIVCERIGWYRSDLHAHSAYSDGRVSHEEICSAASRARLDVLAVTEHSVPTTKIDADGVLVIPSTEVTFDDHGHYNIHGLTALPDLAMFARGARDASSALQALFEHGRHEGWLLGINHPFTLGCELEHDFDIRSLRLIEVINAPHLLDQEIDNERAIRLFDFLWSRGHLLAGVGGSDAHKKNWYSAYPIGVPTTMVHCEGLSIRHVLDACAKGRCFIQVDADFEVALRRPGESGATMLPGERVAGPVECLARCTQPVVWELVRNGEVCSTVRGSRFRETFDVRPGSWWRLQARSDEGDLMLFVNPVHDMRVRATTFGFQSILSEFKRRERA